MNSDQTIRTFTDYYRDRGHHVSDKLRPRSPAGGPGAVHHGGHAPADSVPAGQPHPLGRRLVSVQRCLRTTDLEEVGDPSHLTVFQMLGSWSLGDYDGPQSLRWGYELLVDGFGIDPKWLHVTVYGGDGTVPPDTSSRRVWSELGVPVEVTVEDNWWDNGPVGPCGPDSEIFFWTGDGPPIGTPTTDDRWVEIWNHVMMRYHRRPDGSSGPAAAAERRHRHGSGAAGDRAAGQAVGVRLGRLRAVGALGLVAVDAARSVICESSAIISARRW